MKTRQILYSSMLIVFSLFITFMLVRYSHRLEVKVFYVVASFIVNFLFLELLCAAVIAWITHRELDKRARIRAARRVQSLYDDCQCPMCRTEREEMAAIKKKKFKLRF